MSIRPSIRVQSIQDKRYRKTPEPWVARWTINGKAKSKSFKTRVLADDFRSQLNIAAGQLVDWDESSGLPISWSPVSTPTVAECATALLAEEWEELSPNSRRSLTEALARFVEASATAELPVGRGCSMAAFRRELRNIIAGPYSEGLPNGEVDAWVAEASPAVDALVVANLRQVDEKLRCRDNGSLAASNTYVRYRGAAQRCLKFAVREGHITSFEWPEEKVGRSRRKKVKVQVAPRTRRLDELPNSSQLFALLEAMENDKAESRRYRALTAVGGLAGLRPSEAVVLEVEDLITKGGLSYLSVSKAWNGAGRAWGAEDEDVFVPKTGTSRLVPATTQLVREIGLWAEFASITSGPLFLNKKGHPPMNWGRALAVGCRKVGIRELSPYGLRHTNATLLMESGVRLGVIADRLGNSVEVLVKHYLGWLQGSQEEGQERFEAFLGTIQNL